MWLKLDGAEIIFERRSLFLEYEKNKQEITSSVGRTEKEKLLSIPYAGFDVRLFSRTENRLRVRG
jgi:hypothetical protein